MIESPLIAELLGQAEAKATVTTKAETLLRVIHKRYREISEDLVTPIRACTETVQLDGWLDIALEADSLEQFRQRANI